MKVDCVGCKGKFNVNPENFANYEVVFCPVCELSHQITKEDTNVIVKAALNA
jgi:hypothetical protein